MYVVTMVASAQSHLQIVDPGMVSSLGSRTLSNLEHCRLRSNIGKTKVVVSHIRLLSLLLRQRLDEPVVQNKTGAQF